MKTFEWYTTLVKPNWAPPSWIFGPVWTVLYIIIAVTYSYVAYLWYLKQVPFIVFFPFLLNLIFNILFTPIQFGLKNLTLATIDIYLVLVTLIWALVAIYPFAKWVTFTNIPYLLWVLFATILQTTITALNW